MAVLRTLISSLGLYDPEASDNSPPALRRRLAEHGAAYPPRAIAFYHVGIVAQGVNALLFGALNLLSRRKQPMRQFSTEADARRWLDEQRPVKTPDGAR